MGVELKGNSSDILNTEVARNGTMGTTIGSNGLVQANTIHHNGTEAVNYNWEGGGLKTAVISGTRILDNWVHDEQGPGIWCDINCANVEIARNRVERVAHIGIFYEISETGNIHDIVVIDAGMFWQSGIGGAGIAISSSSTTSVVGNILAWNRDGIVVLAAVRQDGSSQSRPSWDVAYRNTIANNTIISDQTGGFLFGINQTNVASDACNPANGNTVSGNRRWVNVESGPPRTATGGGYDRYLLCAPDGGGYSDLASFRAAGGYALGLSAMTTAQKDAVIATNGLNAGRALVFEP